jgi:diguanylate cyclase (GGDEF)-like protein
MRASFKVKLAFYFLLLAVLPLAAALWGFSSVTRRAEERRVDARLGAELRAVVASYHRGLATVDAQARRLARNRSVQQRLARKPHRIEMGPRASLSAIHIVHVRVGTQALGTITVRVPLDQAFVRRLGAEAALSRSDRLLFVRHKPSNGGSDAGSLKAVAASVSGSHYRALKSGPLPGQPHVELALLAPAAAIARDAGVAQRRLLWVMLGALILVAAIAAAEGRSVVRTLGELAAGARAIGEGDLDRRVPVRGRDELAQLGDAFNAMTGHLRRRLRELELQRGRLRESLNRIGELLAGTHDSDQLLPLIASAALETSGAEGAVLISEAGAVIEVGDLESEGERVELSIAVGDSRFGILLLQAPEFTTDELAAARSLVGQAAVALENARLHHELEIQAISDGLTGLANRRRCEQVLAAEIARSERYGTPLAIVLTDIDGFKAANDSGGHAFGDLVLREFAIVLGETLRDVDLAGRWGGEEFLVLLPGTDLAGGLDAAERIRAAFAGRDFKSPGDADTTITASFGVAEFRPGLTADPLVGAADEALYAAKRQGKNRVEAAAGDATTSA